METLLKIVSFGLITGLFAMLIGKVINHLTRDTEEKQFYTPEETEAMRKRSYERLKQ